MTTPDPAELAAERPSLRNCVRALTALVLLALAGLALAVGRGLVPELRRHTGLIGEFRFFQIFPAGRTIIETNLFNSMLGNILELCQ
jgi:hypothetical protein